MPGEGIIDITAIVDMMKSTMVMIGVKAAFAKLIAIPGLGWIALPIVSTLAKSLMTKLFTWAEEVPEKAMFYENTIIRKQSDATDFSTLVKFQTQFGPTLTPEEFLYYENARIASFKQLVLLT